MSHSASIDIHGQPQQSHRPIELVDALLAEGWTYNDNGHISYLPLGDKENCSWQHEDLKNWAVVRAIIDSKTSCNELVGISLVYRDTGIGGDWLLHSDLHTIMLSLQINRRTIPGNFRVSDFSWYLERIIPAVEKLGFQIERIACEDSH